MMNCVFVSDVGRVRSVNEDCTWVDQLESGYTLAIVADGMGGHQAGDIASRMAVETITEDLGALPTGLSVEACGEELKKAILHANEAVFRKASEHVEYHSMGTTVVAGIFAGRDGVIAHIGDSRAYHFRQGQLIQLTDDHSLVNELLKNNQISAEEATVHPHRNVVTRALGTDEQVEVDMNRVSLEPGDILLLCSDGLSNYVTPEQMALTLGSEDLGLQGRADRLLQLALSAGGDDNISVALLEQHEDAGSGKKEWNS
ncbi:Stp1/IreP family PP2C-type Ser/Thr phosphatase [Paenibacillus phoenicis]|uniref:Stp1/IreP family PP2C-type Ser/Thr phosphatase n=1 Tax=Paenibacillus phoenicis TaxID=554117 RepID=A0ABU5PKA3_9BACL|nr:MULTISPECIES: Stp1/IreP family PP2C-type Ser/Thr phosphatase [Paenibacillus]EES72836.1 serine/threonine phosphatase stp [Paenibacillus sp. oral taxon 786 str. D14]MEA3570097.1 Stp1/IreP family PP2C-type Ser/Thr phosphatase [Paenibacillus phoenicis]